MGRAYFEAKHAESYMEYIFIFLEKFVIIKIISVESFLHFTSIVVVCVG